MNHAYMTSLVLALVLASASACEISASDPLPDIGAPCQTSEGHCDVESVCAPSATGSASGVCAPVLSYGACDAKLAVTHPPGRAGTDKAVVELNIKSSADVALVQNVRSVSGEVLVYNKTSDVDLADLCDFRALQSVGNSLAIGKASTLTSLDGLQSFTNATGGIAIFANNKLTDVSALANLVSLSPRSINGQDVDVVIAANAQLKDADVDAFVTALQARVSRTLKVIACNNRGPHTCNPVETALVGVLAANGLP